MQSPPRTQYDASGGPIVTRRAGTSTAVTKRRRPSVPWPIPRRWPTVTSSTAATSPRSAPESWSTRRPGVQRHPVAQEPRPPGVGADEADVLAVGLGRGAQSEVGGQGTDRRLRHLPHGEHGPGELVLAEHGQHVGLVLGRVRPPQQPPGTVGIPFDPGVVARGHGVEPEVRRPVQEAVELEVSVALDAGIGRPSLDVAGDVGVDDVGLELGAEVEDVVDDAQLVGDPSGVVDVGHRAAARVGVTSPQLEGGAHHAAGPVGTDEERGGHRRVDSTGHGHQDPHGISFAGASTTPGTRASAWSTSCPVVVTPNEKRSPDEAWRRSSPIASSTWLGSTAPLEQAAPAEAATPASSSSTTAASDSTPAIRRWRMPATRSVAVAGLDRPGHRGQEPVGQPVAQGPDPGHRLVALGHRGGQGGRRAHRARHVGRPAAAPPLLSPAVEARPDPGARAHHQRAAPLGATELVAADRHQGGRGGVRATSSHGTAWTASVCRTAPGAPAATIRATSSSGWTVPTSLFTAMTDTRPTSGRQASARAARSTRPSGPLGTSRSSAPVRAARDRQARSTAWCSIAEHTTAGGGPSGRAAATASQPPWTARSSASVPPEVRTTSPGAAPSSSARRSRASSSATRARRDSVWAPDGLANPSVRRGSMASRASGRSGVVAAWSR